MFLKSYHIYMYASVDLYGGDQAVRVTIGAAQQQKEVCEITSIKKKKSFLDVVILLFPDQECW